MREPVGSPFFEGLLNAFLLEIVLGLCGWWLYCHLAPILSKVMGGIWP